MHIKFTRTHFVTGIDRAYEILQFVLKCMDAWGPRHNSLFNPSYI